MDRRVEVVRSLARLAIRAARRAIPETQNFPSAEATQRELQIFFPISYRAFRGSAWLAIVITGDYKLHGDFSCHFPSFIGTYSVFVFRRYCRIGGPRRRVPHFPSSLTKL
jgi:hypothetical protein